MTTVVFVMRTPSARPPAALPPCRPAELAFLETRVKVPAYVLDERRAELANLLKGTGTSIVETKLKTDRDGDLCFAIRTGAGDELHGTVALAKRGSLLWQESRCFSDMLEVFRPGTHIDHASVQAWERRMAADKSYPKEFTGCNVHRGRTQVMIRPLKAGSQNNLEGDATIVDVRISLSDTNCISVQFGAKGAGQLQYSIHLPTVGYARPGLLVSELDALQEILRMTEEGEPMDERKFFNIGLALHKTFNLVITPSKTSMYVLPSKSAEAKRAPPPWEQFLAPTPLAIEYPRQVYGDDVAKAPSVGGAARSPSGGSVGGAARSPTGGSVGGAARSPTGGSVGGAGRPTRPIPPTPTPTKPSSSASSSSSSGASSPSPYPDIGLISPVYMKGADRPEVWKGEIISQAKTVAVKIFPEDQMTEFNYEKDILEKLPTHSNIIKLHKTFEGPGRPCLILEWVSGGTLEHFIASSGKLTPRTAIDIVRQIAVGLQHLHKNTILHRDMKSPNVMIDDSNGQIRVVIIDLGLGAETVAESQSFMTMRMCGAEGGTLFWEAPEIIMKGEYSTKSDIYSLGVILWELLAQQTPFKDLKFKNQSDEFQFRMAVVRPIHESPLRPSLDVISRAPPRLISLITRCWHPDPRFRPPLDLIIEVLDDEAACLSYEDLVVYRQSMKLQALLDSPTAVSLPQFIDLCEQLPRFLALSSDDVPRAFNLLSQGPRHSGPSSSASASSAPLPSHLVVLFIDNVLVRGSDQVFKRLQTEAHHSALDRDLFPLQRRNFNTELRQEWSVKGWLNSIGMSEYVDRFISEEVTHQFLTGATTMTDEGLSELVSNPAHRALMIERAKDIPKIASK